jgi:hypothetical protein
MKTGPKFLSALPALFLVLAACGSDDPVVSGTPSVVALEGVVLSDAWDEPLNVPVLVRVFRSDGTGGWNEAEANPSGEWSMQVELREGCEPGETLEAAAWITAQDHLPLDEDLGVGHPIVCDVETQPLEYSLFRNVFREPVAVAGELQASQLSGFHSTCAVAEQGTFCWGPETSWGPGAPEPTSVPGGDAFEAVESGLGHTCALDGDGAAWCWGSNQNGVLGVSGIESSSEPVPVDTDLRFVELAANYEATCGRDADGQLFCWGMYGDETPVPFGGDLRFEQISGNSTHMCGVEAGSGRVWCWGDNRRGELGRQEQERFDEPVLVEGVEGAHLVGTGPMYTCALKQDGELHCWGWNCDGQLGRFGGPASDPVPQLVPLAPPMVRMALGYGFMCGLTGDGEVWCWGLNHLGQLGSATELGIRSVDPVRVSGDLPFTSLSAGFRSACALTADGAPYCWGQRDYLGTGLPRLYDTAEAAGAPAQWSAEGMSGLPLSMGSSCPN